MIESDAKGIIADLKSSTVEDVLAALWKLSGLDEKLASPIANEVISLTNHTDSVVRERVAFVAGKCVRDNYTVEKICDWISSEQDQTVLSILVHSVVDIVKSNQDRNRKIEMRLAQLALDPTRDPELRLDCSTCLQFSKDVISLREYASNVGNSSIEEIEYKREWLEKLAI